MAWPADWIDTCHDAIPSLLLLESSLGLFCDVCEMGGAIYRKPVWITKHRGYQSYIYIYISGCFPDVVMFCWSSI